MRNPGLILLGVATLTLLSLAMSPFADDGSSGDSSQPPEASDQVVDESSPAPTPPESWLATTSPQFTCGVRLLSGGGGSAATFTCWVAGAPPGDSLFNVQGMRIVDTSGTTRPIGTICDAGAIADRSGQCSGTLSDPGGGPLIGGVLIEAVLQPSGTHLGPIHIAPTLGA